MSKNTVATTSTGQQITGSGTLNRVIVHTHSSGVIKLVDAPNSSSGRVLLENFTLTAGAQVLELNLEYYEGVHFVLVSGTATVSFAYSNTSN